MKHEACPSKVGGTGEASDQGRRSLLRPWMLLLLLLAGCVVLGLMPVSDRSSRLYFALAIPGMWLATLWLLRRWRRPFVAALVPGIAAGVFLCLPGRRADPARLRGLYVRHIESYEGTRYVWGGESPRGIDCSGLVRRALVNAEIELGLRTFNPGLVRSGLALWWFDCRARDLRDGYRGLTAPVREAKSINALAADPARLEPGDLAVTANGAHVLAFLGNGCWMEADPDPMKVVRLQAPGDNMWLRTPVCVVRWAVLRE